MTRKLVLASASPRRRELLAQAGYAFSVQAADIDESRRDDEAAAEYVRRLALEKAAAVARMHPMAVVLGADTTVVLDGQVLNKPRDREEAEAMLRALSGRTHQVHTGLAVVADGVSRTHVETTDVSFREIEEDELAAYLASGDAMDKAGGYGIQGYAARWVPRVVGDYFNVVGLPLCAVVGMVGDSRQ